MSEIARQIRDVAVPLTGGAGDYDALLKRAGDARFVLLGEASHGTHEFYRERAQITQRLIREKGFHAVAVEADWPDAYRINRYVRGLGPEKDAVESLAGFKRFPQWMWRNADVLDFVGWLRTHNDGIGKYEEKAGFYGLDLYSLHASIEAVLSYLEKLDPASARRARKHYACFDHFGSDTESYGLAAGMGLDTRCEHEVIRELMELRRRESDYSRRDGQVAADEYFFAEQNAVVIKNAEEYYRTMFRRDVSSWNLRDNHMMDTLTALVEHLREVHRRPKIVVWAHNSHLGDAGATEMSARGEINVGHLVRAAHGDDAVLIGFTTHTGTVTAASDWDEPAERKRVRPSLPDSYEALFHEVELPRFWLDLKTHPQLANALMKPRLERAIGVIYRPETERISHYFNARLPEQFDGVLHFDETRAVEPLERAVKNQPLEMQETYPRGL